MNRKKVIYISVLLVITVIVSITYFSYAYLTRKDEHKGKLNIITGTLEYKIEASEISNNQVVLSAGETKEIEIELTSLNNINSKYELYYEDIEDVEVGYLSEGDLPTGTINAKSSKTIKLVLKNNANTQKSVTLGVKGGFVNNTLVLGSNQNSIEETSISGCIVGTEYVFDYTGNYQTFTTPCTGKYKIELWGASGGDDPTNANILGGKGAYTSGEIILFEDNNLYIYVGSSAENTTNYTYNGGGVKGRDGANGGGATDVRYFGNTTPSSSDLVWNSSLGFNSRIMVAAGGGGGLCYASACNNGAAAGGLTGYSGTKTTSYSDAQNISANTGGTQTAPGTFQSNYSIVAAKFGLSGKDTYSPGGGGGYYGGSFGSDGNHIEYTGAGGSSYISGHAGCLAIAQGSTSEPRALKSGCTSSSTSLECSKHYSNLYFKNTVMIDGQGYNWTTSKGSSTGMPKHDDTTGTMTGNTGNGYAKITYIGPVESGYTWEFEYSGDYQQFTIPVSGTYKLEVWGAQGGSTTSYSGGKGGYATGNKILAENEKLYIVVGGVGVTATTKNKVYSGGYNGGGNAYTLNTSSYAAGSGGGATHIARVTGTLSSIGYNSFVTQGNGLIIAGGGGGAMYAYYGSTNSYYATGGYGGGLTAGPATGGTTYNTSVGNCAGGGQTVTTSVTGGESKRAGQPGSFGQGGYLAPSNSSSSGGGGGLYGGASCRNYGSGGGSSWIGGVINGTTIAGNASMPTHDGTSTMVGNTGNGYARITFLNN